MIKPETIVKRLEKLYGKPKTALKHKTAFELLVSTILSAQCTDERVNKVTPSLFKRFPTPQKMMKADIKELQDLVRSTGFFNNKSKSIKNCSQYLVEKYDGEIPQNMDELVKCPGVGRKTANVILGNYFNIKSGIVVDTHVKRLSYRLGYTKNQNADKIEQDLLEIIPKKYWIYFSNLLIQHGRNICKARSPLCNDCVLNTKCPKHGIK